MALLLIKVIVDPESKECKEAPLPIVMKIEVD
jgi:hypothetical protein